MHQVLTAYRNAGRAGTKAQKSRAEVRGGGRKPCRRRAPARRARARSRSPIWVGGGRTFAAKPRDFAQKVNRKMYRGALRSMLSELVRTERLLVTEGIDLRTPKTKLLARQLADWSLATVLIVVEAQRREAVPRGAQPAARRGHRSRRHQPARRSPPSTRC